MSIHSIYTITDTAFCARTGIMYLPPFLVRRLLLILLVLLFAPFGWAGQPAQQKLSFQELQQRREQAKGDPVKLLLLCPLAPESALKELRSDVFEFIQNVDQTKRRIWAAKIADALPQALNTPESAEDGRSQLPVTSKLIQILGPRPAISRQILYRSYIERWTYENPIPVQITIFYGRGKSPVIRRRIQIISKN